MPQPTHRPPYVLALDQGTSSSRALIFDADGHMVASAHAPLTNHFPQAGWVEQDPLEIWDTQWQTARQALAQAGLSARDIAAMGITNQRETTVLWDRRSGQPLHRAIVWQDRRTAAHCQQLREQGLEPLFQSKTGLVLDPYFSGTKLAWLLEHVPQARTLADQGHLAFGTVDTWLLWNLSGGAVHATDPSNASRTLLWDLHTGQWAPDLLQALNIPPSLMPSIQASSSFWGLAQARWLGAEIPIGGIAGDQQAALFGQQCLQAGMAKNTYGTGCFMLMQLGDQPLSSQHGLLTTAAAQTGPQAQYALEGSVFMGGAIVQWLRDGLGAISDSAAVESLAASVEDAGGVTVVPAFTGLGAPYWQPQARGIITGLTRGSTLAHIARASVESIAFQSAAVLQAMSADAQAHGHAPIRELRVDGGACVNDSLMQFQANLLGVPVLRPQMVESTALGAAQLAGLHAGVWPNAKALASCWHLERCFEPQWSPDRAASAMAQWDRAVRQAVA